MVMSPVPPCVFKLGSVAYLPPGVHFSEVDLIKARALNKRIKQQVTGYGSLSNERLRDLDDEPHGLAALHESPTNNPGTR